MMSSFMKINGAWKEGTPYLKEGGAWKEIGAVTARLNGKWADVAPPKPASPVFGVRIAINNPSPNDAVEYIDDATGFTPMTRNSPGSWANHPLISGIKPVLHKPDGTWQDLNKRDLQAGITDLANAGNILTRIPTWWLSITEDTEYQYIRFCQEKLDDTYYKLASYFKGKDQGMFHAGCYHGPTSKFKSGFSKSTTIPTYIRDVQAIGNGFDLFSFRHLQYIFALFVVLFKGRDAKSLLGVGYEGTEMPSPFPGGLPMIRVQPDFDTTFDNDYGMKGSESTEDHVSFFWLSDFWGLVRDYIGGLFTDREYNGIYINGIRVNDSGELLSFGGQETFYATPLAEGYTKKMDMRSVETAFIPAVSGGSATTYWCANSHYTLLEDYGYGSFGGGVKDNLSSEGKSPFSINLSTSYSPTGPNNGYSCRIVYRLAVE